MKGGSDVVLNRCSHAYHFGKVVPLTPELKQRYETLNEVLAQKGRRVLACCEKEVDGGKDIWTDFQTDPANFPLGNSEEVVAKAVADGLKAAEEEKDPVEAKKTKSAVGRPQEIDRKTHFLRIHSID
jgi:magnesium-transporting ATPase (P-type)